MFQKNWKTFLISRDCPMKRRIKSSPSLTLLFLWRNLPPCLLFYLYVFLFVSLRLSLPCFFELFVIASLSFADTGVVRSYVHHCFCDAPPLVSSTSLKFRLTTLTLLILQFCTFLWQSSVLCSI